MEFTKKEERFLKWIEKGRPKHLGVYITILVLSSFVFGAFLLMLAIKGHMQRGDFYMFMFWVLLLGFIDSQRTSTSIIKKYQQRIKELEGK